MSIKTTLKKLGKFVINALALTSVTMFGTPKEREETMALLMAYNMKQTGVKA